MLGLQARGIGRVRLDRSEVLDPSGEIGTGCQLLGGIEGWASQLPSACSCDSNIMIFTTPVSPSSVTQPILRISAAPHMVSQTHGVRLPRDPLAHKALRGHDGSGGRGDQGVWATNFG